MESSVLLQNTKEEEEEDDFPHRSHNNNNINNNNSSNKRKNSDYLKTSDSERNQKRNKISSYAESSCSSDNDDSDDDDDDYSNKKAKKKSTHNNNNNNKIKNGVTVKKEEKVSIKDEPQSPIKKRVVTPKKSSPPSKKGASSSGTTTTTTTTTIKKEKSEKKAEAEPVWEWWKEEKPSDGSKWSFLEHNGPCFAPEYVPLPKNVRFFYDGKMVELSPEAEEVATFYAKFIEHEYTSKEVFNTNFFTDWRNNYMNEGEKKVIKELSKCNFVEINEHFKRITEARKNRSKEEKLEEKKKNEAIVKQYGMCMLDKYKQKIGNFRIEPPGLFRGRGDHPKMGLIKRRLYPEDVIINCSKNSKVPVPPAGHKWKEVRHDNSVSWLACWCENVQGNYKYVMLNASSKLKGEKDWSKYEKARALHGKIDKIRENYTRDLKDKEMKIRQRAVALYFIDKLALRAGNEKDEDEADTVGCCSLRVEHIKLHESLDDQKHVVEFDFLGKDSIRYQNSVSVTKRVFRNLQLFVKGKQGPDDLFDRLNTTLVNKYLSDIMNGLTAKVFRTYNASLTLEQQLAELTDPGVDVANKILAYNRANRAVAVLCNHQRAIPKTHEKSMDVLKSKTLEKRTAIAETKAELKRLKADFKAQKLASTKKAFETKMKKFETLKTQLVKLEVQATDKDENKSIALGTSKLNYLDPRITVAWCKRFEVPLEKVYSKTQREKFQWAIDMATKDFLFSESVQGEKQGRGKARGDGKSQKRKSKLIDDDDEEEDEEEEENGEDEDEEETSD